MLKSSAFTNTCCTPIDIRIDGPLLYKFKDPPTHTKWWLFHPHIIVWIYGLTTGILTYKLKNRTTLLHVRNKGPSHPPISVRTMDPPAQPLSSYQVLPSRYRLIRNYILRLTKAIVLTERNMIHLYNCIWVLYLLNIFTLLKDMFT